MKSAFNEHSHFPRILEQQTNLQTRSGRSRHTLEFYLQQYPLLPRQVCDTCNETWESLAKIVSTSQQVHSAHRGRPLAHLVARWAAEWRVERSILLWGNVSSQIHLISPGCPRPNSALTVHKSGLKHRSSIHPFCSSTSTAASSVQTEIPSKFSRLYKVHTNTSWIYHRLLINWQK